MKYDIIYKTTNLVNGKFYVGKHTQEGLEFDGYLGSGLLISRAIDKYGVESFTREILEIICPQLANINEREIYWIASLSATNKENAYNIFPGGDGWVSEVSLERWKDPEFRRKQSESLKEYLNRPEIKEKRSRYTKEFWKDEEYRNSHIEAANRPEVIYERSQNMRSQWKDPNKKDLAKRRLSGFKWDDPEYVKRMREINSSPEKIQKLKKFKQKYHYILKDFGGRIFETDNLFEFCHKHGLDQSSMWRVIFQKSKNGKVPTQHKGWTCISWSLLEK